MTRNNPTSLGDAVALADKLQVPMPGMLSVPKWVGAGSFDPSAMIHLNNHDRGMSVYWRTWCGVEAWPASYTDRPRRAGMSTIWYMVFLGLDSTSPSLPVHHRCLVNWLTSIGYLHRYTKPRESEMPPAPRPLIGPTPTVGDGGEIEPMSTGAQVPLDRINAVMFGGRWEQVEKGTFEVKIGLYGMSGNRAERTQTATPLTAEAEQAFTFKKVGGRQEYISGSLVEIQAFQYI